MNSKDDGRQAFPTLMKAGELAVSEGGMTLRDYFAAKAMQGILASPNCPMKVCSKELSRQCFEAADAMLEARK